MGESAWGGCRVSSEGREAVGYCGSGRVAMASEWRRSERRGCGVRWSEFGCVVSGGVGGATLRSAGSLL